MSVELENVAALATQLIAAERDRTPIPMLTLATPALDQAAAYRVQKAVVESRVASGDRLLGYKLGLVSRAKQQAMGVDEPLWGLLTAGMLHDEDRPLNVDALIHPRVEPEIAFLLEHDIAGENASVATVLAATAGVLPALEILDSRFEDFRFTIADVIADNASAARIVLGGRLMPVDRVDLQLEGMVLRRGGEVVDTAAGAAISGHPAGAVAWLARVAGGLSAGSIVLSGGLTAPVSLEPGVCVTAEFTTLGMVSLRVR